MLYEPVHGDCEYPLYVVTGCRKIAGVIRPRETEIEQTPLVPLVLTMHGPEVTCPGCLVHMDSRFETA